MNTGRFIAGILVGGQSRRMGACKALLPFRGASFLERIVDVARMVVDEVVLLGNTTLHLPGSAGALQLQDAPGFAGPLAGLVPLLEHARDRRALLIACDMPLLEPGLLGRLLEACGESVDAAAFRVSDECGTHFPCCAAFHPRTLPAAREELTRSCRLQRLLKRVRCREIDLSAAETRCLRSFNTPEDYAELIASESRLPVGALG